ncbi:MAG: ArgE/DapE family deacylase [Parvibaculaceae bacterium]
MADNSKSPAPSELCRVLRGLAAKRRDWAVDALCRLVRAETVLGNEAEGQDIMARMFEDMGLAVDRFDCDYAGLAARRGYAAPVVGSSAGRPNVVGIYDPPAPAAGRSLVLNGHIDVVPAGAPSSWASPPFDPQVRDGKVFGRGAGDMKAGLVANCLAFELIRDAGLAPASRVTYQSVIEEECTGLGTLACLARGYSGDGAIIPEPFGRTILVAQLGVLWVEIEATGRSAHVLDTSRGLNAILALYKIHEALRALEAKWNLPENRPAAYRETSHPINFNLGVIEGGDWPSSVPQRARMQVRVSFFPEQDLTEVKRRVEETVRREVAAREDLAGIGVTLNFRGHAAEGYVAPRSEFLERLKTAHRTVAGGVPSELASTATTDTRFFQIYDGVPATCYGPVGGNFHGVDEWVDIESMLDVAVVLALFTADWCGLLHA